MHYTKTNASLHAQNEDYSFHPQLHHGVQSHRPVCCGLLSSGALCEHWQVAACYCSSGPGHYRLLPTAAESWGATSSIALLLLLHSWLHPDSRVLSGLEGLLEDFASWRLELESNVTFSYEPDSPLQQMRPHNQKAWVVKGCQEPSLSFLMAVKIALLLANHLQAV